MALIDHTFKDITEKDIFDFKYNETEDFLGHRFVHIGSGIFKAEKPFDIKTNELKTVFANIDNCMWVFGNLNHKRGRKKDSVLTVRYATNQLWCNVVVHDVILLRWLLSKGEKDIEVRRTQSDSLNSFEGNYTSFNRERLFDDYNNDINSVKNREVALEPINLVKGKLGEMPVISIKGAKAALVEPGIYFFGEKETRYTGDMAASNFHPEININNKFEVPCSMLGYSTDFHPSFDCGIKYFAVGTEASRRLRDIWRTTDCFYHEFGVSVDEDERIREERKSNGTLSQDELNALFAGRDVEIEAYTEDLKNKYDKCMELKREWIIQREQEIKSLIEEGRADTVVSGTEGLYFRNISVKYKTLLNKAHKTKMYDFVFVMDGWLYLESIDVDYGKVSVYKNQSKVCIEAITILLVSAEVELKCGVTYPINIEVLNRQQEVKERFIKPELLDILDEIESVEER